MRRTTGRSSTRETSIRKLLRNTMNSSARSSNSLIKIAQISWSKRTSATMLIAGIQAAATALNYLDSVTSSTGSTILFTQKSVSTRSWGESKCRPSETKESIQKKCKVWSTNATVSFRSCSLWATWLWITLKISQQIFSQSSWTELLIKFYRALRSSSKEGSRTWKKNSTNPRTWSAQCKSSLMQLKTRKNSSWSTSKNLSKQKKKSSSITLI